MAGGKLYHPRIRCGIAAVDDFAVVRHAGPADASCTGCVLQVPYLHAFPAVFPATVRGNRFPIEADLMTASLQRLNTMIPGIAPGPLLFMEI